jgi:hypothetical protein
MVGKFKMWALGAIAVSSVALGGAAIAQQLNPGISCIEGEVPPMDWAELTSMHKESMWDTKAAVKLVAESSQLELTVTDTFGSPVCEQTADLRTRCKFNFPSSYSGLFNIRVDNFSATTTKYNLCAE